VLFCFKNLDFMAKLYVISTILSKCKTVFKKHQYQEVLFSKSVLCLNSISTKTIFDDVSICSCY
jgi:hypothetical protein